MGLCTATTLDVDVSRLARNWEFFALHFRGHLRKLAKQLFIDSKPTLGGKVSRFSVDERRRKWKKIKKNP